MIRLFSYVVEHDHGFAPNPCDHLCTLAKCKHGYTGWKNITELAAKGDWIAGTGGKNSKKSAGHGNLIYAMRVDQKMTLAEYCLMYSDRRIDAGKEKVEADREVLLSRHFFYFGKNAVPIPRRFRDDLEKKGPGYRNDFCPEFIHDFAEWLNENWDVGVYGAPCLPHEEIKISLSYRSAGGKISKRCK